ncbi:solute carrier family 7 member 14 [Drosophila virilis]|nr:uncharacterized protein LOC6628410 [Drosophila virilis]
MSSASLLDALCCGSGARLALGTSVITYLIAYNEAAAPGLVFGTVLATIYGAMAARCKSSLRSLQMPYVRATNKFDFGCLFLATWMDALTAMCACAALARTLSACLDAMTGGLARILILGRNSPANEPWPDVLGVAVVFLVTGMFMLGLEHSKAFSFIMTLGMFGLNAILSAVGWWRGDFLAWSENYFQPNGISSLLLTTALLTYAFPSVFPQQHRGGRITALMVVALVCISLLLTAICLSTVLHFKAREDYVAVPLFNILDDSGFHKLVPASACMLLLTSSAAFLEIFPELYGIVVRLATSEWRILSKQISYESSDSGNPVLAVFIAGSLCAMLAFACPLQHLSYCLAASHLTAVFLRAFYLLYIPYRPKFMQPSSSESSLSYSRLSTAPIAKSSSSSSPATASSSRVKRSLWNIGLPKQRGLKKPKNKQRNKPEVEKEWLLLGEPTSPCPQREGRDVESTILSDSEPPPSDFEYPDQFDKSDSDTSTDIDAIVDEYRQKVKVTTAGPLERSVRVPTVSSWRVTIFAIVVIGLGIALCVAGLVLRWAPAAFTGSIGVFIVAIMMGIIPQYTGSVINVSPVLCAMCLLLSVVFFSACAVHSWPGVLVWLLGGLILLMRCDKYCCNCFDQTTILNAQLIPSVSGKASTSAAAVAATSIRMPRPPKGVISLPQRVSGIR